MLESSAAGHVLLDMCTIRAEPVLDFYMEHLELPENVIKQFNMQLEGIETAAGLVILSKYMCTGIVIHICKNQICKINIISIQTFVS